MQNLIVEKGLISAEELSTLLQDPTSQTPPRKCETPKDRTKKNKAETGKDNNCQNSIASSSEVTIYKRAVRQIAPEFETQIESFIADVRKNGNAKEKIDTTPLSQKVSTSSEEMLDTSDENGLNNQFHTFTVGAMAQAHDKTPEQRADDFIRESKKNKATMLQVPGKVTGRDIIAIDNDYQMINANIDDTLRKRILNFEYMDFSKLLP